MNDDDFDNYISSHWDDLANAFIEKHEDEFEEYCLERFQNLDAVDADRLYEEYRERKFEESLSD